MNLAITTKVHDSLVAAYNSKKYNVFVLEGGSRSSKTHSVVQFWIKYAWLNRGTPRRVAICRLKGTWLSATILFDFINVLSAYGLYDNKNHNKTNKVYKLWDTEFWFMGLDDAQKVHGFASDAFHLNEAVECGYDDYAQLMQRCTGFAVLDYNPSEEEHWIYERILKRDKTWYNHSTFNDNAFISTNARLQILSYDPNNPINVKNGTADKNKWDIYGLGLRSKIEGVILTNWDTVKEIPLYAKQVKHRSGLDWGYSNDPTAIVDVYFSGNEIWVDEICYQTDLLYSHIADVIKHAEGLKNVKMYCDSTEGRGIEELTRRGINAHKAEKPPGSVVVGLTILKGCIIHVTERSVNLIKELKNYKWQQDKNGKFINEPLGGDDHLIDALRYVAYMEMRPPVSAEKQKKLQNTLGGLR